ncbi:IclR family transcriptional regulator [Aquabacterium sp. OR-4]|uniref:IclR family transcriptional regulator n=1 Tax=Aquabacterium sp. OR-4 TaxID=2978127 RepID=UPI0021B4302E|nr:IclR family transcriptional regulator [Aquabacterium sp. OR-4]MDT7833735.1 IclR family transcriptional regulator [Aquabacterium sp. OR-4]
MGRQRELAGSDALAVVAEDRRFVTALARGLEVLRSFRPADRWLAHQEIARRTGLPQATVSRLTFTLTALGYLRHRGTRGEYALAPGVLALGFSMLNNFDIGRIARPHMQALADETQAAVSLGVRRSLTMVYVAHCRSAAPLTLGLDVGTQLPLASTAMGRALYVALQPAEQARLLSDLEAESQQPARGNAPPRPAWPQLRQGLERAQLQQRQLGYVTSETEWEADISAAGVAIDLGDGREPLSLTVGGPAARLQGKRLSDEIAPALVRSALAIRHTLQSGGWTDY